MKQKGMKMWMSGSISSRSVVTLYYSLRTKREEYFMTSSSNAKTLSPVEVYEAVNDIYKGQLKAELLGKGPQIK